MVAAICWKIPKATIAQNPNSGTNKKATIDGMRTILARSMPCFGPKYAAYLAATIENGTFSKYKTP